MKVLVVGLSGGVEAALRDELDDEDVVFSSVATIEQAWTRLGRADVPVIAVLAVSSESAASSTPPDMPPPRSENPPLYVIGVVDDEHVEFLDRLFERGFDDVIRREAPLTAWTARVRQGRRILVERKTRRRQCERSELARRTSEQLLQKITAQIPGAVFEFRLTAEGEREIPYISQGIEPLYGVTPEEAREDPSRMFEGIILEEDLEEIEEQIVESAEELTLFEQEFRIRSPEGIKWILVHSRPERQSDGSTVWYGMLREVTHRKELERQLRSADRLASLGTLSAGIAHEINNPLTFMVSNLSYIEQRLAELDWPDEHVETEMEELDRAITSALDGVDRIRQLIDRLEGFSHQGEETLETVDLEEVIGTAFKIVQNELRYTTDLIVQLRDRTPVEARSRELVQVLVNVLINAAQALSDEEPEENEIEIVVEETVDSVRLSVRDNGPGIPEEHLDRIFDPFFTTKSVDEGTGLGLYMCHDLITSMQGRIEVDSEVGEGTTMAIDLRPSTSGEVERPDRPRRVRGGRFEIDRVFIGADNLQVGLNLARLLAEIPTIVIATGQYRTWASWREREDFDAVILKVTASNLDRESVRQCIDPRGGGVGVLATERRSENVRNFLDQVEAPVLTSPVGVDKLNDFLERLADGAD